MRKLYCTLLKDGKLLPDGFSTMEVEADSLRSACDLLEEALGSLGVLAVITSVPKSDVSYQDIDA